METQENIKITSEKYRPVANRTSLIFFLMGNLSKIHTYYIYSLAAFTKVFFRGIDLCTSAELREKQNTAEAVFNARKKLKGAMNAVKIANMLGAAAAEAAEDREPGEAPAEAAAAEVEPEAAAAEDDEGDEEAGGVQMTDEEMAERCTVLIERCAHNLLHPTNKPRPWARPVPTNCGTHPHLRSHHSPILPPLCVRA